MNGAYGRDESDLESLARGTLPQHRVTKLSPRQPVEMFELRALFGGGAGGRQGTMMGMAVGGDASYDGGSAVGSARTPIYSLGGGGGWGGEGMAMQTQMMDHAQSSSSGNNGGGNNNNPSSSLLLLPQGGRSPLLLSSNDVGGVGGGNEDVVVSAMQKVNNIIKFSIKSPSPTNYLITI